MDKTTLLVLALLFLPSCGPKLSCSLNGDNVAGRISFAEGINISGRGVVRMEWSTDGFATVKGFDTDENIHSLPAFWYSVCIENDTELTFRVYQDTNLNRQFDTGEASGRYDLTSDGNGAFIPRSIPGSSSTSSWITIPDLDIVVDVP